MGEKLAGCTHALCDVHKWPGAELFSVMHT